MTRELTRELMSWVMGYACGAARRMLPPGAAPRGQGAGRSGAGPRTPGVPRLALALLVALLLQPAAVGAQELFRSNAAGTAVSPISESQRESHEYVLKVERTDGVRERSLFREGELTRLERLRLDGRGRVVEEERYEDGVLREVRRFDERGRLTEELEYDDTGLLAGRSEVEYENGRRVTERHFNADDTLRYTDRFAYDSRGRIRRVRREHDGTLLRSTSYAYAGGRLFEESFRTGDMLAVVRYDSRGRVAYRAERRDGELVAEQEYSYESPDAYNLTYRRPTEPETRVERYIDGRLVTSREEIDGEVVSRAAYEYAGGRLARVVTDGRNIAGRRVEQYYYDENGDLSRRVVEVAGRTVRE
ncbi:MAG: hypothetical protein R6W94_05980, partial [Spirochaetia bacterium]